jgi:alkylation response protein AidB-like acyl-CoA dehydrogenase
MTDEQQELRMVIREFLAERTQDQGARATLEDSGSWDPQIWTALGRDLGILGLGVSEEFGGSGGTIVDASILAEEAGRQLIPGPFIGTLMLGIPLLDALSATSAPAADILSRACTGECVITVVSDVTLDPVMSGDAVRLDAASATLVGTVQRVVDAKSADELLVIARDSDGALVLMAVPAKSEGLVIVDQPSLDSTMNLSEVEFRSVVGVELARGEVLAAAMSSMAWASLILSSARYLGAAHGALDMAVDYAKIRQQFGRAIGSFQAIKHMLADVHIEIVSAAAAVTSALRDENVGDPVRASMAAASVKDALWLSASTNIQVHGGVGFTWEHDAHLYFKNAVVGQQVFGTADQHRDSIANAVLPVAVLEESEVRL